MLTERRSCLRHEVHGPVFASFDGVTGGMILDLSERGLAMQTTVPVAADQEVHLRLDLPDTEALETTGYVAWADALGRAGIRFSELPQEARQRLDQWLAVHEEAPSHRAPKLTLYPTFEPNPAVARGESEKHNTQSISLEAEAGTDDSSTQAPASSTMQYEFHPLSSDLNAALRTISERARTLLRGGGAAIALVDHGSGMICRASVGSGCPPLGTPVDVGSGFSGECVRSGKALRCDDTETDSRVAADVCRRLGIRSLVAAPLRYQQDVVGLLEVCSPHSFAFDEGDLAVVERLAQTAILKVSQTQGLMRN
jgi:hypothetical protein